MFRATRELSDAFDAGVRVFFEDVATLSPAGIAPVMLKSASSILSAGCAFGILVRVDFDFVTSPSLSSLKLLTGSTVSLSFAGADLGCSFRGAGFATRAVVDVILVLFGRGIFTIER